MKLLYQHIFLILFTLPFQGVGQEITENNWGNHPQITNIRQIYNEIEENIKSQLFESLKVDYEYDEPYDDTEREYYLDSNQLIRKFVKFGGSGDSALKRSFYYDSKGNLIFFFAEGGAVNGTSIEHRIYFNNKERIWEIRKLITGPGWGFPDPWIETDIVYYPCEYYHIDKK